MFTRTRLSLAVILVALAALDACRKAPQRTDLTTVPIAPVLHVDAKPQSAALGQPITFTATIEPSRTDVLGYEWSFKAADMPDLYSRLPHVAFAYHLLGVQHCEVRIVLADTSTLRASVPVFIFQP